jgi:hypothetical protein
LLDPISEEEEEEEEGICRNDVEQHMKEKC